MKRSVPTYIIPVGDVFGCAETDYHLRYCPADGTVAVVDRNGLSRVGDGPTHEVAFDEWRSADDICGLYVILTYACNFKCSYCYSAAGRGAGTLRPDILSRALRAFLSPVKRGRRLAVNFIGGGEPLMADDLLRCAVVEIRSVAREHGLDVKIGVITNGSLVTEDDIAFFVEHDVELKISFDILPEVQSAQRGAFDVVAANIERASARMPVSIRSVITPANVRLQRDMVHYVAERFKAVRRLKFDPVVSAGLFSDANSSDRFASDYAREFLRAWRYARTCGITLNNSVTRLLESPVDRFCRPSLTLTPNGSLTACVCFSSPNETGFSSVDLGTVTDEIVDWNHPRLERYLKTAGAVSAECGTCFLRYHCAGGCSAQNGVYGELIRRAFCSGRRELARRYLLELLNDGLSRQTGRTLARTLGVKEVDDENA